MNTIEQTYWQNCFLLLSFLGACTMDFLSLNVALSVLYIAVTLRSNTVMKRRDAFALSLPLIIFYNLFQIAFNMYMVYGLSQLDVVLLNPFLFNTIKTQSSQYFMYLHAVSKLVDFVDTLIIVLRKKEKQLSFLHVFHHSTINIIWAYLYFNGWAFGSITFGAWLNSFVHCVMYTHYLLLALKIRHPFKRWVTRLQMSQFMLCIVHSVLFPFFERVNGGPWKLQLAYQITMMLLFASFSRKTYAKVHDK